jgi:hypothetical protein
MKVDFTPVTKHATTLAEAARRLEKQGHCAVQLPLMEQPRCQTPGVGSISG